MFNLGVGVGAGDDVKPWIGPPGLRHHPTGLEGVGDRHHQATRDEIAGRRQHPSVGGVAVQHLKARVPRPPLGCVIQVDDQEWASGEFQPLRKTPPHLAKAHHDDMVTERGRSQIVGWNRQGDRGHLHRQPETVAERR